MRKLVKRTLSLVLAVLVLASMACVVASANDGLKANPAIGDVITSTEGTNTYYFYMPDSWKNQYNDTYTGDLSSCSAGIYWYDGDKELMPAAWPGYNVSEQVAPNVFVAHVPADVTTIIWNNTVDGGMDNTLDVYTAAIQTKNIPSEFFGPDDPTDDYKFYPEGTTSFNEMIYVCDPEATEINDYSGKSQFKGSWFYYYGDGKYGTHKTLAEAEAAGLVYANGQFPAYGFQISNEEIDVAVGKTDVIKPNKSNAPAEVADSSIASIEQNPETGDVTVTGVSAGKTTVTFTYKDEDGVVTTKTCNVNVYVPATVVTVKAAKVTTYVKKTVKANAKVENAVGSTTYKSSNTKVATVDKKGVITAKKAGTATITVTNNGKKATIKVTVKNPEVKAKATSIKVKKTTTITVKNAVGKTTFKTSNKKIATVSSKGVVKGVKKGTVKITVTASGVKKVITIKVK